MTISAVSLTLSIIALGVSTTLALSQTRLMRSANTLPILVDFFREFRETKFRNSQRIMYEYLPLCSPDQGLYGLPDEVRSHVIYILHYYDNLGAMVAHKLVSSKVVLSAYAESLDRCWKVTEPFVRREREIRHSADYDAFFEHLASLASNEGGKRVRARLGLRARPTDNLQR